jgi:hypothetical protein
MTETGYFLAGLGICSFVALSIIVIIHKRFSVMMVDLCEGEERARFWSLAVEAWFFLYSVSSALRWYPEGTSDRQLFLAGVNQVKDGLNGTSNAIILFSVALIVFVVIRKFKGSEKDILRRSNV